MRTQRLRCGLIVNCQNGHDCGIYSIDVVAKLITGVGSEGLLDSQTPLSFSGCLHPQRKKLLQETMITIHQSLALYESLPELMEDQPLLSDGIDPMIMDNLRSMMFGSISAFRQVHRKLEEATLACGECFPGRNRVVESALKPIAKSLMASLRPKRIGGDRGNPSRRFITRGNDEIEEERMSSEEGSSSEDVCWEDKEANWRESDNMEEESVQPEEMEEEQGHSEDEEAAQADSGYGSQSKEANWEDGEHTTPPQWECYGKPQMIRNLHKACVTAYQLRNPPSRVRMRKFDLLYDDYDTGPMVEDSLEIFRQLIICFDNERDNFKSASVMLRFRDHGYRLLPSSLDQFYLSDPSLLDQLMHFFPTPPPHIVYEWKQKTTAEPILEDLLPLDGVTSLPYSSVVGVDMVEWGIGDLLSQAGPEKSPSSAMAFVCGMTKAGTEQSRFIRFNLMKDQVRPKDIHISMDIDSVIWLTRRLKTKGAFNLHTSPYRKETAPIYTSNHIYIELVWPRMDEDVSNRRLSSGVMQVPLSNLPNTHFATFGRVEGGGNVAVVFPRMKHRYPLQKHSDTKLPEEVELLWLRHVVYAAVRRLKGQRNQALRGV
jgi:hypothetical protein